MIRVSLEKVGEKNEVTKSVTMSQQDAFDIIDAMIQVRIIADQEEEKLLRATSDTTRDLIKERIRKLRNAEHVLSKLRD